MNRAAEMHWLLSECDHRAVISEMPQEDWQVAPCKSMRSPICVDHEREWNFIRRAAVWVKDACTHRPPVVREDGVFKIRLLRFDRACVARFRDDYLASVCRRDVQLAVLAEGCGCVGLSSLPLRGRHADAGDGNHDDGCQVTKSHHLIRHPCRRLIMKVSAVSWCRASGDIQSAHSAS